MSTELAWFKSSYSGTAGGECVEVAAMTTAVRVRDSKDRSGPQLAFSPAAWADFVAFAAATETPLSRAVGSAGRVSGMRAPSYARGRHRS